MDFALTERQELFRSTVHDWLEREAPKSWARELEKDEHSFPFRIGPITNEKARNSIAEGLGLPRRSF